jgi:hypothetical protein
MRSGGRARRSKPSNLKSKENTMAFMSGFITAAAIAGFIWGYRAWLTKKADDLAAQLKQSIKEVTDKVKAKL